jgi:hypothetical protein
LTLADVARPALNGGLRCRNIFALNGINPKGEEAGKRLASGTYADVGLHEGGVARKVKDRVAWKMMRLELVEV